MYDDNEKKRRYQAYLLSNVKNLKVNTPTQKPSVVVQNIPQQYKIRLAQPKVVKPTAKVTTPYSIYNFSEYQDKPKTGLLNDLAVGGRQFGTGLAQMLSPDVRRAEQARKTSEKLAGDYMLTTAKMAKQNPTPQNIARFKNAQQSFRKEGELRNYEQKKRIEDLDPVKNAAAIADVGFTIATSGMGGLGATFGRQALKQTAKLGGKEGAKALAKLGGNTLGRRIVGGSILGAPTGALDPIIRKGDEATAKEIAVGGASGAVFGGGLQAGTYGLGIGAKYLSKGKLLNSMAKTDDIEVIKNKLNKYFGVDAPENLDDIAQDIASATTKEEVTAVLENAQAKINQPVPNIDGPTDIESELPNTLASINNPTHIKEAITPMFNKLDEPTIDDIAIRLAKATDPTETKKILQEAREKQAELSNTIDEATPEQALTPQEAQTQALQEEIPIQQNAPIAGAKPDPEVQANQVTQEPTGNVKNVENALEANDAKLADPAWHDYNINGSKKLVASAEKEFEKEAKLQDIMGKGAKKRPSYTKAKRQLTLAKKNLKYWEDLKAKYIKEAPQAEPTAPIEKTPANPTEEPISGIKNPGGVLLRADDAGTTLPDGTRIVPVVNEGVDGFAVVRADGESGFFESADEAGKWARGSDEALVNQANEIPTGNSTEPVDTPIDTVPEPVDETIDYARHVSNARTDKKTWRDRFRALKEQWDPEGKLVEEDRWYAKQAGIRAQDLPASRSLMQLFRRVNNVESRTDTALLEQNINDIFQRYANRTEYAEDFNNYSMFQLDLERRADKRNPIFTYTDDQLKGLISDIQARFQQRGVSANLLDSDARRLSQAYQNIQKGVVDGPNAFVGADKLKEVTLKKDGTQYNYYRPVKSKENTQLHKADVRSGNAVSIQEQTIFTDLARADNERDASFAPIFNAIDNIMKQEGEVALGRELMYRNAEGLLRDSKLVVDSNTTARMNDLKKGIQEIRNIMNTFKTAKQSARFKVQKARIETKQSQKSVIGEVKKEIRAEGKSIVTQLRKEIAKEQLKVVEGKGKLGVPKYKKARAESEAVKRAKQLAIKMVGDDTDGQAFVNSMNRNDLLQLFDSVANDVPVPKNVRRIYKKMMNANTKLGQAEEVVDKSARNVDDLRAKIDKVFENGEIANAREILKNTSDNDLMLFASDVIDNDLSSPALKNSYQRFINKSDNLRQLAEDYEFMKMDMERLQAAKEGMRQEIAMIRPSDTTGKQVIHGLDADGNKYTLEISHELARALQPDPFNASGLYKTARAVGAIPRQAFVGYANPAFQINQLIWNIFMSPIFTKQGYKSLNPKALKMAFKATLDANDELALSAGRGGIKKYGSNLLEQTYDSSEAAKRLGTTGSIIKKLNHVIREGRKSPEVLHAYLNELAGNSDKFARYQAAAVEYRKGIKQNLPQEQIDANVAAAYNDALPDFSNLSHAIRNIDSVILFAGAGQAGTRKMLRAFREKPIATTRKMSYLLAPAMGLTLYNLSTEDMSAYYEDLIENNKAYDLENNLIIRNPVEKLEKDPESGEWKGIIKIPIIPELRPANKAIVRSLYSMVKDGKPASSWTYARALFDTVTGQAFTGSGSKNPVMEEVWRQVNNQDRYGNKLVEPEMSTSQGVTARLESAAKSTLGVPGRAVINQMTPDSEQKPWEDKNIVDTYVSSFTDKLKGSKGSTSTSRYYKNTNDAFNKYELTGNERKEYESIFMAGKKDAAGNEREKNYYTKSKEALALLENEKFQNVRREVEMKAREQGAPANPFYDLTPEQQKTVLQLQAQKFSPGNQESINIRKQSEAWYYDYVEKSAKFYGEILGDEEANAGRIDNTGMPIPIPSDELKTKQDQYRSIEDKTMRAKYLEANPDLVDYWDEKNAYQRYVRDQVGLPQFDKYPKASPEIQAMQKEYNALPSKNGPPKKDGTPSSPARSAWIKANPAKWAAMTEYWTMLDIYNLQQEGAQAVYENTQFSDDGIKNILDIAKYINDGNGNSGYGNGYGSKEKTISNNLSQMISRVTPDVGSMPNIKATPTRTKFKVKLPGGRGRKFKKITLN